MTFLKRQNTGQRIDQWLARFMGRGLGRRGNNKGVRKEVLGTARTVLHSDFDGGYTCDVESNSESKVLIF